MEGRQRLIDGDEQKAAPQLDASIYGPAARS
jgi:hypothetical protein